MDQPDTCCRRYTGGGSAIPARRAECGRGEGGEGCCCLSCAGGRSSTYVGCRGPSTSRCAHTHTLLRFNACACGAARTRRQAGAWHANMRPALLLPLMHCDRMLARSVRHSLAAMLMPPLCAVCVCACSRHLLPTRLCGMMLYAHRGVQLWKSTLDKSTGKTYWYNRVTKATTWEDPLPAVTAALAAAAAVGAAVPPPAAAAPAQLAPQQAPVVEAAARRASVAAPASVQPSPAAAPAVDNVVAAAAPVVPLAPDGKPVSSSVCADRCGGVRGSRTACRSRRRLWHYDVCCVCGCVCGSCGRARSINRRAKRIGTTESRKPPRGRIHCLL